MKGIILSIILLALGMALFLIKVLSKKEGEFESQHIHDSKAMRDRGIHCVMDQDREDRARSQRVSKMLKHE